MDEILFELPTIQLSEIGSKQPSTNEVIFSGIQSGTDKIRLAINQLDLQNVSKDLCDLGNITPKYADDFPNYNKELCENYSSTSLIIGSKALLPSIEQQINANIYYQPTTISNRPIIKSEHKVVEIGLQKHYGYSNQGDNSLRLSEIRQDLNRAEVRLRHADLLVIDIAAIRLGDNLGCAQSGSAGFTIEEMCQLAKYAGAGTDLKSLYILGYDENQDVHGMMVKNVALIIWYFLEGFNIRKVERLQPNEMMSYAIMPTNIDQELIFKKHQRTGRWWIEAYSEDLDRSVVMACAPKDYESACSDVITERVLEVLEKV